MIKTSRKLLLVDGHSLIHRAYHAFPATLSTASGEQTNAVYGFTRILLDAIHELNPTHVAVAFDLPGPTFRETMFVGYKRSRVKPDDAMIAQIPRVKEVVQTLGIPIFEVAGYEADDVIGTLAKQGTRAKGQGPREESTQIVILTSDRDLMQLIRGEKVVVKMPERGRRAKGQRPKAKGNSSSPYPLSLIPYPSNYLWDEKRFVEAWGFKPELLPDYKAFAGDQSDDIPGVRGIGEKTAKALISQFGSVDDVYRVITQNSKLKTQNYKSKLKTFSKKIVQKLVEDQEAAQMSKKLATIDTDVPIKLDWDAMEVHGYDKEKAIQLFEELQFKSLNPKLPNDSFEERVQEVLF